MKESKKHLSIINVEYKGEWICLLDQYLNPAGNAEYFDEVFDIQEIEKIKRGLPAFENDIIRNQMDFREEKQIKSFKEWLKEDK